MLKSYYPISKFLEMAYKHSGELLPAFLNGKVSTQHFYNGESQRIFSELASFQWVSTKDQLPELGRRVLLFFSKPCGKSFSNMIVGQLVYAAGKDTSYLLDCGEIEDVADYWMPLPFTP